MIIMSQRSAENFMRFSHSFVAAPTGTASKLYFFEVDPTILTDPVKMASVKITQTSGLFPVYPGKLIGTIAAQLVFDEALKVMRVKQIDLASQAAANSATGTPNLCVIGFMLSPGSNKFAAMVSLPCGVGKPVELLKTSFDAVGQPLRLKSLAYRLKGY